MQYWKELSSSEVHIFSSQSPERSAQEASLAGQETRSRSTTHQHPGSALLHPDGKPQLPADPPPLEELLGAYPRLWHEIARVTAVTEPRPTRKGRLVLDLRVALPASPTALPEAQSTLLSTEAFATESTRC